MFPDSVKGSFIHSTVYLPVQLLPPPTACFILKLACLFDRRIVSMVKKNPFTIVRQIQIQTFQHPPRTRNMWREEGSNKCTIGSIPCHLWSTLYVILWCGCQHELFIYWWCMCAESEYSWELINREKPHQLCADVCSGYQESLNCWTNC